MLAKVIFRVFDNLRGPYVFERLWHLFTNVRSLTRAEIEEASRVLGDSAILYDSVRVAQGGILRVGFRLNKQRPFATFHTINLPSSDQPRGEHFATLIHELVHVYQFETVGSIYISQALRAQRREGYDYGGWEQLAEDHKGGKRFCDFNREQQGQIVEDYYVNVIANCLQIEDPCRSAYEPFIADMRKRLL